MGIQKRKMKIPVSMGIWRYVFKKSLFKKTQREKFYLSRVEFPISLCLHSPETSSASGKLADKNAGLGVIGKDVLGLPRPDWTSKR